MRGVTMKQIEFQTVVYPFRGDIAMPADAAWAQIAVGEKFTTITVLHYLIKVKTSDFERALSRDIKRDQELFLNILDYDKISEPDVKIIRDSGKSKLTIITDNSKKLWVPRTVSISEKMSVKFPRRDKKIFTLSFRNEQQKFEFRDKRIFLRIIHEVQKTEKQL